VLFRHAGIGMAKLGGDHAYRHPVHGEMRTVGMAEDVEGHRGRDPGAGACLVERPFLVRGPPRLAIGPQEAMIRLIGEVNDEAKQPFLAGAAALLFPIDWPEPFGLVMIEAMACGTPVIALRGSAGLAQAQLTHINPSGLFCFNSTREPLKGT
jgi:glycosyltransferase involved in cell wall biosynthesis